MHKPFEVSIEYGSTNAPATTPNEKPAEFSKFEELARKLVQIPKEKLAGGDKKT